MKKNLKKMMMNKRGGDRPLFFYLEKIQESCKKNVKKIKYNKKKL